MREKRKIDGKRFIMTEKNNEGKEIKIVKRKGEAKGIDKG